MSDGPRERRPDDVCLWDDLRLAGLILLALWLASCADGLPREPPGDEPASVAVDGAAAVADRGPDMAGVGGRPRLGRDVEAVLARRDDIEVLAVAPQGTPIVSSRASGRARLERYGG